MSRGLLRSWLTKPKVELRGFVVRVPEHRVVQRVDRLDADLQPHAARQIEVLVEADVEQVQMVGADVRQRRREVAHVVAELDARVACGRRAARNVEARGVPRRAVETGHAAAGTRARRCANGGRADRGPGRSRRVLQVSGKPLWYW